MVLHGSTCMIQPPHPDTIRKHHAEAHAATGNRADLLNGLKKSAASSTPLTTDAQKGRA